MDEQRVRGNWGEIKQELTSIWGELTNQELENAKGNLHKIMNIVHEKYGESEEEIEKKIDRFLIKYSPRS